LKKIEIRDEQKKGFNRGRTSAKPGDSGISSRKIQSILKSSLKVSTEWSSQNISKSIDKLDSKKEVRFFKKMSIYYYNPTNVIQSDKR